MTSSGGCATAVWDEYRAGAKRRVVLASDACGDAGAWSTPEVLSSPDVDASYPIVVGTARGSLAAWTERAGSGEVAWKTRVLAPPQNTAAR